MREKHSRLHRFPAAITKWTEAERENSVSTERRRGKSRGAFRLSEDSLSIYAGNRDGHSVATLAERKTRYYIAIKIPDRKGETMAKAIIDALSKFPEGAVKTITCDRGSEFACWREIEKALSCDMYFADPYCAWQKGTNENLNGLLREFYPKGRNLSRVSPATLKKNLALINARPKKVLHYQTPQDLFELNLSNCCT